MTPGPVSLGYVILTVRDVRASLAFYRSAFGLSERFFHDEAGEAYGELETGATRLAFLSLPLARKSLGLEVRLPSLDTPPPVEIALVTPDVEALFARAVASGAQPLKAPAPKPWGQIVAYVRDQDGHLVELCSPLP